MSAIESDFERVLAAARTLDGMLPPPMQLPHARRAARRIVCGDRRALADLCDTLADRLVAYAYFRMGDYEAAKDAVYHICAVAKRQHAKLPADMNHAIWLLRLTRETLLTLGDANWVHKDVRLGAQQKLLPRLLELEPDEQEWVVLRLYLRLGAADASAVIGIEPDDGLVRQACALTAMYDMAA